MKLNIFGRKIEVLRENDEWAVYLLGEGKKRKAGDVVIPAEIKEDGVERFLEDLFHEIGTPDKSE